MSTVDNVQIGNQHVTSALEVMETEIESIVNIIQGIYSASEKAEESTNRLKDLGQTIVSGSIQIKEIGQENLNNFHKLEEGFEKL